jgi:hypothetical protein
MEYKITETIFLKGRLANHFYNMKTQEKAWHKPAFETNLGAKTTFLDNKLMVEGMFFFRSGIFYQDLTTEATEKLPVVFDFNANAQFNIFKQTYLFINWSNITASKYNLWYQYPVYRTVLMGGLKLVL